MTTIWFWSEWIIAKVRKCTFLVLYHNQTCDDISACAENADASPWLLWNINIASDKALLFWCLFYMWIGPTAHKFEVLLKVSLATPDLKGGSLAKRVWLAYISFIILTFLSKGYMHFTTKALSHCTIFQHSLASSLSNVPMHLSYLLDFCT